MLARWEHQPDWFRNLWETVSGQSPFFWIEYIIIMKDGCGLHIDKMIDNQIYRRLEGTLFVQLESSFAGRSTAVLQNQFPNFLIGFKSYLYSCHDWCLYKPYQWLSMRPPLTYRPQGYGCQLCKLLHFSSSFYRSRPDWSPGHVEAMVMLDLGFTWVKKTGLQDGLMVSTELGQFSLKMTSSA